MTVHTMPKPSTDKAQIFRISMRILAVLGLLLPWMFYGFHLAKGGSLAPSGFMAAATVNDVTKAITVDVYLAALAFAAWVLHERRVRAPWIYAVLCFCVGLSFALPLYLAARYTPKPELADARA